MASFYEVINRILRPYYTYILITFLLILFLLGAHYAYTNFYTKKMEKKNNKFADVANAEKRSNEIIIYFFNVDWCPHCKTAKPEWDKFTKLYEGKAKGEYVIKCMNYNCTDETSEVTQTINKYNIDSYPTVKMVKDNQVIDFDAKITRDHLEQFVETMI
jgi:thiol-disulfide isomerase/thioredoxin